MYAEAVATYLAQGGATVSDVYPLRNPFELENKETSMRWLGDPEIQKIELRRVLVRMWNFVAHDGEVPNQGDPHFDLIAAKRQDIIREVNSGFKHAKRHVPLEARRVGTPNLASTSRQPPASDRQ